MDASQKLVVAKGQPHHLPRLAYNSFTEILIDDKYFVKITINK